MIHKIYHQFSQPFFENERSALQDRKLNQSFDSLCQNPKSQMCQSLGYSNIQQGLDSLTDREVILVPIQNTLASFVIHTDTANLSALGLNWMLSYEIAELAGSSIASIEICESCLQETSIARIQAQDKKLFHLILDPKFVLKSQADRGRILVELLIQAILEFEYNFCKYSIELDAFIKRMNDNQVWHLLESKLEQGDAGSRITREQFDRIQDDVLTTSTQILGFMDDIQQTSDEQHLFDIVERIQAHVLKHKKFFLLLDFCARDIRNDFAYHRIYMSNLCAIPSFIVPISLTKGRSRSFMPNTRNSNQSSGYGYGREDSTAFGWEPQGSELENYAWYQEAPKSRSFQSSSKVDNSRSDLQDYAWYQESDDESELSKYAWNQPQSSTNTQKKSQKRDSNLEDYAWYRENDENDFSEQSDRFDSRNLFPKNIDQTRRFDIHPIGLKDDAPRPAHTTKRVKKEN